MLNVECLWTGSIEETGDRISVVFKRVSDDLEEGYPGRLNVCVVYSLTKENCLEMTFTASGNVVPTVVNMTNHAYWNLSGDLKRTVDQHVGRVCGVFPRSFRLTPTRTWMARI